MPLSTKINKETSLSTTIYYALLVACFGLLYFILQQVYGIFHLPFFWDELGVYSQSALYMADHDLSILPASVPDNISRGHPLIATFVYSLGFKILGTQLWVAKFSSVLIYFIGILFCFKTLKLFTTNFWAFLLSLIVLVQPIFVSQSLMILPELLLSTITISSIYYYLKEKYILCIITICLAVLTKESGLVLPIAFGITHLLVTRKWLQSFALFVIPIAVFVLFLVVQKMQNGYFLYPLHESLINFQWHDILVKKRELSQFIFHSQGRTFFTYGILLSVIIYFFRDKITAYNLRDKKVFVLVAFLFIGGFTFSIINFYLARYSQFFLMPLFLLAVIFMSKLPKWTTLLFSIFLIVIGIQNMDNKEKFVDSDMAYVAHIKTQEQAFDYIRKEIAVEDTIGYNWPMSMTFWNRNIGFNLPQNKSIEIYKDKALTPKYIAVTDPGELIEKEQILKNYTLLKVIKVDYATVTIYRRKL
jgi:4-amino-4-deoxy-L-arabinose transferase-like glycosyltransferase